MQLSQIAVVDASFDEPNLIGSAGLVPVMRLARRAGLGSLVAERLRVPGVQVSMLRRRSPRWWPGDHRRGQHR